MTTMFWWLAGAGVVLVLLAAGTLVALNFSEQAYLPLLSAVVVGVLTFTITFVSSLRSTAQETVFATSVVEDTRSHLPVFVTPDPNRSAISLRALDLSTVARVALTPGPLPQPAVSETEVTTFNLELLQYLIIRYLRDRQRVRWALAQVATPQGLVARASVNRPPTLSGPVDLKGQSVMAHLANNRFAKAPFEQFQWDSIGLLLPRGASLALRSEPGAEGKGPQVVQIVVQRPNYFAVTITVTPIGTTGPGVLPDGLLVPPADRAYCRTHSYLISAKAQFSRLTAGNWRTEENKTWVRWAFRELEGQFRDSPPGP